MQLVPRPQRNDSSSKSFNADLAFEQPPLKVVGKADAFSHDREPEGFSKHHDRNAQDILRDRVVIFIDGSNLFYAAMQLGLEIDYSKLLQCLTGKRRLIRAYFYTGIDRSNEKQQGFLLWMRRHGYRVVTKDLIQHPDGSKRANLDVEMTVDMMTLAKYCDTVILLSGDGNLTYAVNAIAYQGAQVEVVSLQTMASDSLINIADRFIDLTTIKSKIQRDDAENRSQAISR